MNQYAKTAYNSQKPRTLPPSTHSKRPRFWQSRYWRHSLKSPPYCGEYLGKIKGDQKRPDIQEKLKHERIYLEIFSGWPSILKFLRIFICVPLLLCAAASPLLILLMLIGEGWRSALTTLVYAIVFGILLPFFLMWLIKILLKLGPALKYIELNRRTGMITFPQRAKKPPLVLAYDEFEPRYVVNYQANGAIIHTLRLVHRYSDCFLRCGGGTLGKIIIFRDYYEQFMDISQPLPDIPSLESNRHLDPTTAAFDIQQQRPKDYWASQSDEEIEHLAILSTQRAMLILGKEAFDR